MLLFTEWFRVPSKQQYTNIFKLLTKYHCLIVQDCRNYRKRMDRRNIRESCRKNICVELSEYIGIWVDTLPTRYAIGDTNDTLSVFHDWIIKHFKEAVQNKNKVIKKLS